MCEIYRLDFTAVRGDQYENVYLRNSGTTYKLSRSTLDSFDGIRVSLQLWKPYAASIFKVWPNHGFI